MCRRCNGEYENALGKLFLETIFNGNVDSLGREESAASTAARKERNSRKQAWVRAPEMSCGDPLRRRLSSEKVEEQDAVVWVRRSSWLSVTESEEFVGRLSFVSLFPQYLSLSV